MTTVRWGMIGCGDVSEVKSGPAYSLVEGARLVAVASRRATQARDYAERHGVEQVFEDAQALIRSPEVDAVYIATPPASHLSLALEVAAAGKPCCVEKPIANSHADALAMVRAFEEAGQKLFVAYYRRALPRFLQVKSWIDDGRIGDIRHVQWTLTRPPSPADLARRAAWRTDKEAAPGGYFDDLACHGLDLFDFMLGPIARAAGFSRNQQGLYEVPDAVTGSWVHESGATGSGLWNFGTSTAEDGVRIFGSDGEVRFAIFDEAALLLETASGTETLEIANPVPIQLHHVEQMMAHLAGGAAYSSTGANAARTAWVMDRILDRPEP